MDIHRSNAVWSKRRKHAPYTFIHGFSDSIYTMVNNHLFEFRAVAADQLLVMPKLQVRL